ncbi:MAG: hypothetical protein KBC64_02000 [Simkaniaceae bacterium]|nr:hypothetical protein [Simkaniaceae bacterium]
MSGPNQPNSGLSSSAQALIDADPTQMSGVAGIAAAESAKLMAALELLNGKFKQDEMQLLNVANQASMNQASNEYSQGMSLAIGAGMSAAVSGLTLGVAAYDGLHDPATKELEKNLKTEDDKLAENEREMKSLQNPQATTVQPGESQEAAAQRLTQRQDLKDNLRTKREELHRNRDTVEREGKSKVKKQQDFRDARRAALQATPQSVQMMAQARSQGEAAQATRNRALNQLASSSAQDLDQARKDLGQTGINLAQINFFAAAVAASRA